MADVDMPSEAPSGRVADRIAQAQAMAQGDAAGVRRNDPRWHGRSRGSPFGADGAAQEPSGTRASSTRRRTRRCSTRCRAATTGQPRAGRRPRWRQGTRPRSLSTASNPRLYKRSFTDQLNSFMPRYRDALRLCPEASMGSSRATPANLPQSGWQQHLRMGRLLGHVLRAARVRRGSGCVGGGDEREGRPGREDVLLGDEG